MSQDNRHRRLRLLLHSLNKDRKRQARQIDILCHDLIQAQRDFIRRLGVVGFSAGVYKSLLGANDLVRILRISGDFIAEAVQGAGIAVFLRQPEGFKVQTLANGVAFGDEHQRLELNFGLELVEAVCKRNRICTFDDLLGLGLEANPSLVSRLSAYTVPLADGCRSIGFLLVYRPAEAPIVAQELASVSAITGGLAKTIESCAVHSPH